MTERTTATWAWLLALGAVLLLDATLQLHGEPLSPQSLANQGFASNPSYVAAIDKFPPVWPPLYPTLLWVCSQLSLLPPHMNILLFAAGIALLVPVGRRIAPDVHPAWWLALYLASSFHLAVLHQIVSETLLVPLALGLAWAVLNCVERGERRDYVIVGAVLAACCLTRYFALVWLAPWVFVALATRTSGAPLARALRAAALTAAATLPTLAWMLYARSATGFLTGIDRFSSRNFEQETSLLMNVSYALRTLFYDWFVPGADASHAVVGSPWSLEPAGTVVAGVALALGGLCVRVWLTRKGSDAPEPRTADWLVAALPLSYPVLLVALWTTGNNDPIYGRFLYPSYVFFGLAAGHVYSVVKSSGSMREHRPFQALYAWLLLAQVAGAWMRISAQAGGTG